MMKWRPWPPLTTKKYEVRLVVGRLEGWDLVREGSGAGEKLTVEIRWKGTSRGKVALSSLRRAVVKRNFTKEVEASQDGVVQWDEEFHTVCSFSCYKDNVFHPWEIAFTVFDVSLAFFSFTLSLGLYGWSIMVKILVLFFVAI